MQPAAAASGDVVDLVDLVEAAFPRTTKIDALGESAMHSTSGCEHADWMGLLIKALALRVFAGLNTNPVQPPEERQPS